MLRYAIPLTLALGAAQTSFAKDFIIKVRKDSLRTFSAKGMTPLFEELGIYKISSRAKSSKAMLESLNQRDDIELAFEDYKMSLRSLPNDSQFSEQWPLNGGVPTGAADAWSISTGGPNALGHSPVVAVIDGGADVSHPDLAANIWKNKGEIAGNGIDDDNNGYVDDVNGWNAYQDNSNIPAGRHGTHVSGIIGAVGNNGVGVSGVLWSTKVMPIAGASGRVSVVLKAYNYALKQKKIFLESKGKKGANVVSTNSSFGVDGADCSASKYTVWNDVYNAMGAYGILSVAATANRAWNIDQVGDVPTGCSSPYIVSVTNTNSTDGLYSSAGFGKKTIDLAAPGTRVLSTLPGGRYGKLTGTSMATPHVAGAIALLHSAASVRFLEGYNERPQDMALELKAILLNSVDRLAALKDKTVSEGRLNLGKGVTEISKY